MSSILEKLECARIFSIEKVDGGFELAEECDRYFTAKLTSDELRQLADEIKAMADAR